MTEILNEQEDIIEELPEVKEGEEDTTDWKAIAQKNQGIAKRFKTKQEKLKADLEAAKPKPKKAKVKGTDKLDYAQKAFLIANGIKGSEEHQLAFDIMKRLGTDDLDMVVEDEFFMSKIKTLRDKVTLEEATPPSGRTPSSSPKSDVEYWTAKGEMPPADQPKLRQDYVNAKLKAQTDGSPFSSTPVVGGEKR